MSQFDLSIDDVDHDAHVPEKPRKTVMHFMWRTICHVLRLSFYALQRMLAFLLYSFMERPLATIVAGICIWASAHVATTLQHQSGPHPSPLFAKKDIATKTLPEIPESLFQASYEVPSVGSQDAVDIRAVQQLLAQKGLYKGAVDGRSGPMTVQAVRDFQAQAGLSVDGVLDKNLLGNLQNEKSTRYETDDILIFTVQNRLNQLGFDAGAANGQLSPKTRKAIESFESAQGLSPTGAISAPLLRALTKASLTSKS
ncbi:MAG: peptidoglycan-binding domain-containing protein [Pseudomonadota bacterium]